MSERHFINGHALRALRVSSGRSQHQLAKESDLDHTYISRLENGHRARISADQLDRIAATLAVPAVSLIALPDDSNGTLVAKSAARSAKEIERLRQEAAEYKAAMQVWRNRALRAERTLELIRSLIPTSDEAEVEPEAVPLQAAGRTA